MWARITFAVITAFWVVMMVFLWRTEMGHGRPVGASIPPSTVWDRVLTAPDASQLEIRHGTNRIGMCRWRPDVAQEFTSTSSDPDEALEGMVRHVAYYTLDLDGTVSLADLPTRARFLMSIKLDTNRSWQTFSLKITLRPDVYELTANSAEQTVRLHVDAGADKLDRTWRFADLQNPQKLLADVGGPALPLLLGITGPLNSTTNMAQTLGMNWEARNDALMLGKNKVRTFRLKGTFLERYHLHIYVSPVGEVLRIDLPEKVSLVNEALSGLHKSE